VLDTSTPTVLIIAGSDSYAGAGVQIDIKTVHALGGYAFSAITAITSQNSTGVKSVYIPPSHILESQIKTILDDIAVDAIKIGMLGNADNARVVADILEEYEVQNIVLDPVIASSSGDALLDEEGIEIIKERLFPLASLITPNIPELHLLSDIDARIPTDTLGAQAILLKGGHSDNRTESIDYLLQRDGVSREFASERIDTAHTHGTGCILSSAIATGLAQGYDIEKSISAAKEFLTSNLKNSRLNFSYKTDSKYRNESIF